MTLGGPGSASPDLKFWQQNPLSLPLDIFLIKKNCIYVCHIYGEADEGIGSSGTGATGSSVWFLGTELGSPGRAGSSCNC